MSVWIEKLSSDRVGLEQLAQDLSIHPLALEDCFHRNQRAKFDDFENHQLLVWFALIEGEIYELEFVIFPTRLLLVAETLPPSGNDWFEFLGISAKHQDGYHLLYHALDRAMDLTERSTRPLFEGIEEFEQRVFKETTDPRTLLKLKRQISEVEFALAPLASLVAQLQRFYQPKDDLRWRLRDLFDHAERVHAALVFHRSQIASAMEMYWGFTAKRTNDRIKKLTLVASVSVPLSFWCSFWGMNFEAIPFASPRLFYVALGLMGLSALAIYFVLRRKGYWEKD